MKKILLLRFIYNLVFLAIYSILLFTIFNTMRYNSELNPVSIIFFRYNVIPLFICVLIHHIVNSSFIFITIFKNKVVDYSSIKLQKSTAMKIVLILLKVMVSVAVMAAFGVTIYSNSSDIIKNIITEFTPQNYISSEKFNNTTVAVDESFAFDDKIAVDFMHSYEPISYTEKKTKIIIEVKSLNNISDKIVDKTYDTLIKAMENTNDELKETTINGITTKYVVNDNDTKVYIVIKEANSMLFCAFKVFDGTNEFQLDVDSAIQRSTNFFDNNRKLVIKQ